MDPWAKASFILFLNESKRFWIWIFCIACIILTVFLTRKYYGIEKFENFNLNSIV